MANDKLVHLVRQMLRKTESGELAWEETSTSREFQVAFSRYSVRVASEAGHGGTDIRLSILNMEGEVVESFTDVMIRDELPDAFAVMLMIFEGARRVALGVDKAIDSLLEELE